MIRPFFSVNSISFFEWHLCCIPRWRVCGGVVIWKKTLSLRKWSRSISLFRSQPINNRGRAIRLWFVPTMYYDFERFSKSLLQLHHSNILLSLISICSVSSSSDVPTYTSTASSTMSMLSSQNTRWQNYCNKYRKIKVLFLNPELHSNLAFLYMTWLNHSTQTVT